jgi:hypothetical protein
MRPEFCLRFAFLDDQIAIRRLPFLGKSEQVQFIGRPLLGARCFALNRQMRNCELYVVGASQPVDVRYDDQPLRAFHPAL